MPIISERVKKENLFDEFYSCRVGMLSSQLMSKQISNIAFTNCKNVSLERKSLLNKYLNFFTNKNFLIRELYGKYIANSKDRIDKKSIRYFFDKLIKSTHKETFNVKISSIGYEMFMIKKRSKC